MYQLNVHWACAYQQALVRDAAGGEKHKNEQRSNAGFSGNGKRKGPFARLLSILLKL